MALLVGNAYVMQMCRVVSMPIESGVNAIFITMAFRLEVMERNYPGLYELILNIYLSTFGKANRISKGLLAESSG